jgi:hypothetical protein
MKLLAFAILSTVSLALFVPDQAWSAGKKYDRGTCLTLAKQKYGRFVGHTRIPAAADRCVANGPGAL